MSDNTPPTEQIYIARQPIFTADAQVMAYELLFRLDRNDVEANIVNGEFATLDVLLNTFTEFGLNHVVGDSLAFLNLTRAMLMQPLPLPTERVVIEILEDIEVDDEVLDACKKLINQGYLLALDDFDLSCDKIPLLELAHYVKVDVQAHSEKELGELVKKLRAYPVKLVAEKVETHQEFEQCKALGFDLFQGFFLSKPNVVEGEKSSPDKLAVTRLMSELRNPDNKVADIEKIIASDPKLSYKILQIINSAAFTKANKIESLQQAIVYMGLDRLKDWASLIAISSMQSRSPELMINAMIRAKMCELLAKTTGESHRQLDRYFTVGLFSMLDAMLDEDLHYLLDQINLENELKKALLEHSGRLGDVLNDVLYYEVADWEKLSVDKIKAGTYRDAYLESINWAMETAKALGTR